MAQPEQSLCKAMSPSNRRQRGYTLAELVSVVFIIGLVMTPIALIMGPLVNSQNRTQAKVDTVQGAAMALYRIERDLRNTNLGSIYECSTAAAPVCTVPASTLSSTGALVIVSAYRNGTGQFVTQSSSGKPYWQGADVYWVDTNGVLNFAFDVPALYTQGNLLSAADARTAVAHVLATGGAGIAQPVEQMSIAVPNVGHKVSFQLKIQSTIGTAINETTFQTDLETRN